jgi:hypothetical protein
MALHFRKNFVNLINCLLNKQKEDPSMGQDKPNHMKCVLTQIADGTVTFQVIEQSDTVTNYLIANGNSFTAKNGWRVIISEYPEIKKNAKIVYLRGSNFKKDTKPNSVWGLKKKEAEQLVKDIQAALADLVGAAKDWKLRYNLVLDRKFVVAPYIFPNIIDQFFNNKSIIILK